MKDAGAESALSGSNGADSSAVDVVGEDQDACLTAGERLLRGTVTRVPPRIWLWLTLLASSHLLGFPLLLSFLAALLGALFFFAIVWQVDFFEAEPWRLVERTFFWGAVPAVILAATGEIVLGQTARSLIHSADANRFDACVIAPIVEELCKGVVLLTLFRRYRNEFDGRLDGLVYGALVGLGFSMTENAFYYMGAEVEHLQGTIVARGLIWGMDHACWSACLGFGLGVAADTTRPTLRRWAPFAGLAAAIGLHSAMNFLVLTEGAEFRLTALALAGLSIGIWLRLTTLARSREAHWIETELADEVQTGVITADEAAETRDINIRKKARSNAFREATAGPANARLRMYELATELAFAKHKARIEPSAYATRVENLRRALARIRPNQPAPLVRL